jgi:dephospho-CoA kinase
MLILGLTGSIATGKTSASDYFKSHGIPVVDADLLARLVVQPGKPAYYRILKHFGHLNILQLNSRYLDRKRLGELIFPNEQMRKQLNKCTHGYIRREALKQIIEYFFQLKPIVIWDVPLLFEVGLNRYLSHTLVISCDQTIQLDRLKQRDNINDNQEALQRINAQMDLNEKCRRARYVIDNSGTKDVLHKELQEFLLTIQPNRINTIIWFTVLFIPISLTYGVLRIWDLFDRVKYRNRS